MTIAQHAHIYSFHILNFIFGPKKNLKFLSILPLPQVSHQRSTGARQQVSGGHLLRLKPNIDGHRKECATGDTT